MDILLKADTNLFDFLRSTSNVLTLDNCSYFFLGNQMIMFDTTANKYSLITEFEYSQLSTTIKEWIFDCTSQTLKNLIS